MKMVSGFNQYSLITKRPKQRTGVDFICFRLTVLFCLFAFSPVRAQEDEAGVIDYFSVTNQPMSEVITQLSIKCNLNFTYDASDPLMDQVISFEVRNISPYGILSDLLANTQHTFKKIGNQVVIYKRDVIDQLTAHEGNPPVNNPVMPEIEIPIVTSQPNVLPAFKIDTIFVKDTIFRIDTIRIVDTVYVAKKNNSAVIQTIPVLSVDHFQNSTYRQPGWAIGLSGSPMASDFSLVNMQRGWSLRNFAVDANLARNQKRWAFSVGIQISQFAQKFDHQYDISTGGYYLQDTLDVYYTVIEFDTAWYYVTDSVWLPLNSQSYHFDRINRVGYVSVSGEVEYTFFHRPAFSMHVKVGVLVSILAYRHGVMIDDDNVPLGTNFGDLVFSSPVVGLTAGVGSRHRLGEKMDLLIDAFYLQYTSSPIPDHVDFKPISAVGLSFGLRYYLN